MERAGDEAGGLQSDTECNTFSPPLPEAKADVLSHDSSLSGDRNTGSRIP
jgi:hypothetical protein